MRITGGIARGRIISGPDGSKVRPTASKVRQAFFNILSQEVPGSSFLDLFAGSGLMGLEALSRGASTLVAVEADRRQARAIEHNLQSLGFVAEVINADVQKALPHLQPQSFDIVFADPPYQSGMYGLVLEAMARYNLLRAQGVFAIEHQREARVEDAPFELVLSDYRQYGQTAIAFYRRRIS